MSLSKPQSSPFEILPDPHHEPRVRYPAWKAAIFELAILQCQAQHVFGCLFMVQTDAECTEYDAFPLRPYTGTGTHNNRLSNDLLWHSPPSPILALRAKGEGEGNLSLQLTVYVYSIHLFTVTVSKL
jgi:hypothetical protein